MEKRYDILFDGSVVEGQDPATVRSQLGALFKASDAALEKLFSGKPQMIKRGVDKATAAKYRTAMHKVGAVALIQLSGADANTPPAQPATNAPTEETAPKQTLADRLAAVAGEAPAADPAADVTPDVTPEPARAPAPAAAATDGDISLAPPGSSVLNEDERHSFEELDIDTSAIQLDPAQDNPAPLPPRAEGKAVDTSHMSMGEVGEDIPKLEAQVEPINPDVSGIDLTPEGTDFSDCAEEPSSVAVPDVSQVSLADEGSDLLEEQYRSKDKAEAPNTDHIKLAD